VWLGSKNKMKNIIDALNWRYATKKFDKNKIIDDSTMEILLEALRLSPSSYGLQPWQFIIVNNKDIREKIRVAGYDQSQITDASSIIIFANKKNIDNALVDDYIKFVSEESGTDILKLEGLGGMIKGSFSDKSDEVKRSWAARQVYLAVGVLITSCAVLGVDACPMEGFNNTSVDKILNLSDLGLESRAIVAIGYRAEDDSSAIRKKIRFPKNKVFIEIN
jgi:nitroreductase